MIFSLAADLVVLIHLAFIVFVVFGGLLLIRWRWLGMLHIPALIWALLLEFNSWVCPLTPLENRLRALAGADAYTAGFIEHYVMPVIYPPGLTPTIQLFLGGALLVINALVYVYVIKRVLSRTV